MAAVAMAAGAWAQRPTEVATPVPDSYIDVTPSYYKFYQGDADLDAMIRADVQLPVAFNLGSNNWVTNNFNGKGENYFSAKQVSEGNVLMGAWVMNNGKKQEFKDGISLYDFGGNIGSALVINYQNSELNEAIKESLGLATAPELPVVDVAVAGNINYFALTDFNAMNDYVLLANPDLTAEDLLQQAETVDITPIRIHVRLILNAYNNTMADVDALTFTYFQNEAGNTFGVTEPADGSYLDLGQFADNGKWSPYGWMVRDYEFDYTGIAGAVKFQSSGITATYNDGATLIRSIEVYVVPEDAEQLPNIEGQSYSANYDSWWDSTTGSIDRTETTAGYPEALYMIGDGPGWTPGAPLAATSAVDGVFTFENVAMTGSPNSYFSFINTVSEDWGLINDGSHRYGPAEGTAAYLTTGDTTEFSLVGDASWNVAAGTYTFVMDFVNNTLTVTGDASEPQPEDVVLYVRGTMNGWGTDDQMVQDAVDKNIYTYSFDNVETGAEFKIADGNWGAYNYGGTAMEVYSNVPGVQTLEYNAGNLSVSNWVGGPMELTFNLETLELTLVGPNQPVGTVGIDSLETAEGEVEYYNLQGVKVANPQNGLYIVRKGNTTSKVIIR